MKPSGWDEFLQEIIHDYDFFNFFYFFLFLFIWNNIIWLNEIGHGMDVRCGID